MKRSFHLPLFRMLPAVFGFLAIFAMALPANAQWLLWGARAGATRAAQTDIATGLTTRYGLVAESEALAASRGGVGLGRLRGMPGTAHSYFEGRAAAAEARAMRRFGITRAARPAVRTATTTETAAARSTALWGETAATEAKVVARASSRGMTWGEQVAATRAAKTPQVFRHYGYAEDAAKFQGGLGPGSYATHARGRPMHGKTAQDRLALPHESPPNAYYKVRVRPGTTVTGPGPVEKTTVPPRGGGGIEYKFPNGTSPGSVTGPFPIPVKK